MSQSQTYQPTVPLHVAIIMDGNGRWAQARRRPRVFGHQAGVKTVRRIVEDAADIGIKHLTLYSFSTENWTRPKTEIAALFQLLKSYVADDLETLNANNVRIRILGSREGLTDDLLQTIEKVENTTRSNSDFFLNIAFNYGGRNEILRAVKTASNRFNIETMTESEFSSCLDTGDIPDPDMVIRTSGEKRISNFLMWQAAYAEFIFTDVLWPDFTRKDLEDAIAEYGTRRRRFGALDVDANAADVA